jgi:predicted SAM-dependent methyltransferase
MRLHIGCGHRVYDGFFNIDAVASPKAPRPPDLLYEFTFDDDGKLLEQIPLDDGVADEIIGIHVFEHFYRWTCEAVVTEFYRLLKPGGLLILELPDLIKCCQNVVDGREGRHDDQLQRWGLYGDPRDKNKFMCHPWGWGPQELMQFLQAHGFNHCKHLPTQFHSCGREHRDMRIEARRA